MTERSLLHPAAVLGQIKMEENLGNRVQLYPRNARKLAAASKCIPDAVFPEAAAVLSRLYSGWTSCSNQDKSDFAKLLAENIQRIPVELLPTIMGQLHEHSSCVLPMTPAQLEYVGGLLSKDSDYNRRRTALVVFMRMKELHRYPELVERVGMHQEWDRYRMTTVLSALTNNGQPAEDELKSWKLVWAARLKAGPVSLEEVQEVLEAFGDKMKLTKYDQGFRLDFELKEEPKPEETKNEIKA